jgi:TRAP-type uncharacterized transport system substrate-binding protein
MTWWEKRVFSRALATILCMVAAVWLALWYFIPAPPSMISIGVGTKGGTFEHIGNKYRERLERHHVKVKLVFSTGSLENANLLNDPKSGVDAGVMLGSVADSLKTPEVVSLGRINYAPIWFLSRSSEPIDRFSQFKGKRVSLNFGSGRTVAKILSAYGVTPENTTFLELTSPDAIKALRSGGVDVISSSGEIDSPFVQTSLRDPMIHVMDMTQADALTQLFPSLNRLVLSRGVIDLEKNIPPSDINLIALTNVVVARANLHPEVIYLLSQTMKEEHGRGGIFHRAGEFPTQADPDLPMAEEALDYYKNGPPYLQRYLPFWMINYAKRVAAILVTAIAIIIPIFSYAPRLYAWLLQVRAEKLYRRLRAIEASLKSDLTASEIANLNSDLENISRSADILPMRRSSMFFDLMMHIRLTRSELSSRLAALRNAA